MEPDTIIIFVHGILEGPDQFKKFVKEASKKGYDFSAILLEGHGGSSKEFANSSKKKWIHSVEKVIRNVSDRYKNIILVGHSMGSLISVLMAIKYKNKVKKLVLIGTPLNVWVKFKMIKTCIKIGCGDIKEDDFLTQKACKAISVGRSSLGGYIKWIPRYIDLFDLIKEAKGKLSKITIPTLIIHTDNDELVSDRSIKIFKKELRNNYEIINLKSSGHFYYDKEELEIILEEFRDFI